MSSQDGDTCSLGASGAVQTCPTAKNIEQIHLGEKMKKKLFRIDMLPKAGTLRGWQKLLACWPRMWNCSLNMTLPMLYRGEESEGAKKGIGD